MKKLSIIFRIIKSSGFLLMMSLILFYGLSIPKLTFCQSWGVETIVSNIGGEGRGTDIVADDSNNPHIIYIPTGQYSFTEKYWDGSAWQTKTSQAVCYDGDGALFDWKGIALAQKNNEFWAISLYNSTDGYTSYVYWHKKVGISSNWGNVYGTDYGQLASHTGTWPARYT
ncbi:MAG: hypothetical protein KJ607_11135, partial [Bacteroidetes bacterium]|nr:hypothetical protein [Bacteroidota bacterium]